MTVKDLLPRPRQVAGFVAAYGVLLAAYHTLSLTGGIVEWVHATTVRPSAAALSWFDAADPVRALGAQLMWRDGRLALLAGCDGADVLMLLVPAALIAPLPWPRRIGIALAGCAVVWLLNQVRVLALVQLFRHQRELFDAVHVVWAPLILLCLAIAWHVWIVSRAVR